MVTVDDSVQGEGLRVSEPTLSVRDFFDCFLQVFVESECPVHLVMKSFILPDGDFLEESSHSLLLQFDLPFCQPVQIKQVVHSGALVVVRLKHGSDHL